MKHLILGCLLFAALHSHAQNESKFNLGFEQLTDKNGLPDGWIKWGNYDIIADSQAYSGARCAKISAPPGASTFGSIAYRIPAYYHGKTIRLEGYIKISNVAAGFAGLLLRIDGNGKSMAFDNMESQNLNGTHDWKKYAISFQYPKGAEELYVAGILVGSGEAWFDDLTLSIDGQDVQHLKTSQPEWFPASADSSFDHGSTVVFPEGSAELWNNLELLGRVWGFLKYHHPAIAEGKYNWDYALFRFLPDYLNVKNTAQRDELLLKWINDLGKVKKCKSCAAGDPNAIQKPDLAWIRQGGLSKALQEKLWFIYQNRHQGNHYYIKLAEQVGNPIFKHESDYPNMTYPDAGFRLLALYRYWNMVQYFYPNKHLMDQDWNLKLKEYIQVFLKAENELAYELAMLHIIGDIQDTHANLWGGGDKISEWKGSYYPPFRVRFVENQWVVTDQLIPNRNSEARPEVGDIITRINGMSIEDMVRQKKHLYPASNSAAMLRDMGRDLLRSSTSSIDIQYTDRKGQVQSQTLNLYPADSLKRYLALKKNNALSYKLLADSIGYITLENIHEEDLPIIKKTFLHTRGIIIDIRNYPSYFVPFALGSYFVSDQTPFVKFSQGNINHPGEFTLTDELEIPSAGETYAGKLVVLVNETSQSQAEYTAMAFRAGEHTTIIGSTTAGADGNVSAITLPGGMKTMISGIGVYYPNGTETQRVGIVPDLEVKPSVEGIRNGRDEVLEKAVELILKQ